MTQGPAYGLLLRNELAARTGREAPLNGGQVYATLDRLLASGLVRQEHDDPDGLARYVLTDAGAAAAAAWLRAPAIDAAGAWESMRFQVLLARSLPEVDSAQLVEQYREFWIGRVGVTARTTEMPGLAESARTILARAALDWLDQVAASSDKGEPLQQTRPPRGRPAGQSTR